SSPDAGPGRSGRRAAVSGPRERGRGHRGAGDGSGRFHPRGGGRRRGAEPGGGGAGRALRPAGARRGSGRSRRRLPRADGGTCRVNNLKSVAALVLKEEKALFSSPIAYAVIAVFLLIMGYTFTSVLFLNKIATLLHIFFQGSVLLLLMVPVVTMRMFAEER